MSFNVILTELIILALATPCVAIFLFFEGYKLGVKEYNRTHKDSPKELPKRRPRKPQGESKRREELETILENIENYDGSSAHQKEIE